MGTEQHVRGVEVGRPRRIEDRASLTVVHDAV
jgi:hypothetical protein